MQEERSVANGTAKREPSGPVASGENEDSSWARGELRRRGRRGRSPSGNLDLRGFEDLDENFVQLVNSVISQIPIPNPDKILILKFSRVGVLCKKERRALDFINSQQAPDVKSVMFKLQIEILIKDKELSEVDYED